MHLNTCGRNKNTHKASEDSCYFLKSKPDIEAHHTGYVPPFAITDFNSTIVDPKSSAVTAVWIPIFFSRRLNGLTVRCVRGMNSFINFFFLGCQSTVLLKLIYSSRWKSLPWTEQQAIITVTYAWAWAQCGFPSMSGSKMRSFHNGKLSEAFIPNCTKISQMCALK